MSATIDPYAAYAKAAELSPPPEAPAYTPEAQAAYDAAHRGLWRAIRREWRRVALEAGCFLFAVAGVTAFVVVVLA